MGVMTPPAMVVSCEVAIVASCVVPGLVIALVLIGCLWLLWTIVIAAGAPDPAPQDIENMESDLESPAYPEVGTLQSRRRGGSRPTTPGGPEPPARCLRRRVPTGAEMPRRRRT